MGIRALLPIMLIVLALLAAAGFAFGTESFWGTHRHGIEIILWSRRLEWPLIGASLLSCSGLFILAIAGRRRVLWLLGLIPVLFLFVHRLSHAPMAEMASIQDPRFITAAETKNLLADDLIVGFSENGHDYAFACKSLFSTPVVIHSGREKNIVLIWNARANRALACVADRDLHAGDLEILSEPNNTLVIYNTRLGEFINGVTGRTFYGSLPAGFHLPIKVVKATWQQWVLLHPDTLVADLPAAQGDFTNPQPQNSVLPGGDPILMDQRRVCLVATTQPIAVPTEMITQRPLNLKAGQTSLLLVRIDGVVCAFNRELPGDLFPRFSPTTDTKHKNAAWLDSDTNSEWTDNGTFIEGAKEMHGLVLKPIPVEDDVYLNVMKYWYPDLQVVNESEISAASMIEAHPVEKQTAPHHRGTRNH